VNEHSFVHHVRWMVCQCWKHFPIVFHYEKVCPSKSHYFAIKIQKISYATIMQLSFGIITLNESAATLVQW
jgi:hypothetical protein